MGAAKFRIFFFFFSSKIDFFWVPKFYYTTRDHRHINMGSLCIGILLLLVMAKGHLRGVRTNSHEFEGWGVPPPEILDFGHF